MVAIIIAILCACSLWRKRRQLCGWGSSGPHSQSGDSAGSCYAPPQYSRCSSFHHAPPPYTEVIKQVSIYLLKHFLLINCLIFCCNFVQVTSKPDLYPLVFTCNADNGKNGGSYLMVQYFRNYIVRPTTGTLSATSTVDSLSSSFICNANEANTLVPPPYSRAASPDLPLTIHDYSTLPRSASQQGCSLEMQQQQQRNHLYRLIPMSCSNASSDERRDTNTPNNTSDGDGSLSGAGSGSSAGCISSGISTSASSTAVCSQLRTSNSANNFQRMHSTSGYNSNHSTNNNNKNNSTIQNNSNNNSSHHRHQHHHHHRIQSNHARETENMLSEQSFENVLRNDSSINTSNINNDVVITNNGQLNNNNLTYSNKNNKNTYGARCTGPNGPNVHIKTKSMVVDNYYTPAGEKIKPNAHYKCGSTSTNGIYNSCGSIEDVNPTVSSDNNLDYKDLDVLRRSLETCCQILDSQKQQQQLASGNFSEESPVNTDILKKYGSYINSITGSGVSSLANIGSPGSPPQATSPTAEVRELLEQIRQLQKDDISQNSHYSANNDERQKILHESMDTYDENSIEQTNKSGLQMQSQRKRPSSLHHQSNRKPTHRMGGFFPISATKNLRSPIGSNSSFLAFGRGRKGWISRSAPTTPGATVPSCLLDDDSPLLNEQDEDADQNT